MGLFDKLLKGADEVYDVKTTLETEVFRDRRFERAEKLAATGDPNTAVITGIKRRYNDSLTDTDIRLEWFAPEPRVGAIHYGADIPLAIRLGSTIAVKTDGDSVVVDPAAMAGVPGAPTAAGRRIGRAPGQGTDDKALDMRVLGRLEQWTPQDATVEAFERFTVMGMPSENWDITVSCSDGTRGSREERLRASLRPVVRRPRCRRTGRHRSPGPRPRPGALALACRAGRRRRRQLAGRSAPGQHRGGSPAGGSGRGADAHRDHGRTTRRDP